MALRVLYALLGAGNGHVGRAREILPTLSRYASVDVAISGTDSQVELPISPRYFYHGLIFRLGQRGGIDVWDTIKDFRPGRLVRDIKTFPIWEYDLLINDFEPISSRAAKRAGVPSISLSHQASFLSERTPRARTPSLVAEGIFRHYAPCDEAVGFHFERYDLFIRTPVVRAEVRKLNPFEGEHVTVYLPAYGDEFLIETLSRIPQVRWEIFSKRAPASLDRLNVKVFPIRSDTYLESLEGCCALLTGGGFEGPSEGMFLGKRLLMVPQEKQYEQLCNAEAARSLGASVLNDLISRQTTQRLRNWLFGPKPARAFFPDETEEIVKGVLGARESREVVGFQ